jgi:hypothetical protein
MSIKLYSFIEQNRQLADEYRCADNSYKYVLDRVSSKDEMVKPLE